MKQLNIKFLLALLISMLGVKASAHDIAVANADGVTIYYTFINDYTELSVNCQGSSYSSYSNEYTGNVVIPESVTYSGTTYPVTSIGKSAFRECSGLTSVTIPNSVTSIESSAFKSCSGLTNITIPNSVTSIGRSVFSGCIGLTSVTIPNSVTSIELSAFLNCSGLKEVHISDLAAWCNIYFPNQWDNPLYYAKRLYLNGDEIIELNIPNSVTKIENYAFHSCSDLTSVTIPNSVTSIGRAAFSGCSGLTCIEGSKLNKISAESFALSAFSYVISSQFSNLFCKLGLSLCTKEANV